MTTIHARQVVNAAGAWAMRVARLAGGWAGAGALDEAATAELRYEGRNGGQPQVAALELARAGRTVALVEARTYLGTEVTATLRPWIPVPPEGDLSKYPEIITACIASIKAAGLAEDIEYSIRGRDILLKLSIKGCSMMEKEVLLRKSGIRPYNCPITNMILDQLIEKLGYCTTYVAELGVPEESEAGPCQVKAAIYATPEKIGVVSDWSQQ